MEQERGDTSDSTAEYFARLGRRLEEGEGVAKTIIQVHRFANSAEKHFKRFELPRKRHHRAVNLNNDIAIVYERRVMLILLHEIVDTSYIVMYLLDFNELNLDSSTYGQGLSGDTAAEVVHVLQTLEDQCKRVIQLEKKFELKVDFSAPLDEVEGITFNRHGHWRDLVPGSLELSFYTYFARAQESIRERLDQRPAFWEGQTVRQYLYRKGYNSLIEMLHRLEKANLPRYG